MCLVAAITEPGPARRMTDCAADHLPNLASPSARQFAAHDDAELSLLTIPSFTLYHESSEVNFLVDDDTLAAPREAAFTNDDAGGASFINTADCAEPRAVTHGHLGT